MAESYAIKNHVFFLLRFIGGRVVRHKESRFFYYASLVAESYAIKKHVFYYTSFGGRGVRHKVSCSLYYASLVAEAYAIKKHVFNNLH